MYRRDPARPLGETREDVDANGSFEGNVITVQVPKSFLETNLTLPADGPRTLDNIYVYGMDGKSAAAWDDSLRPAWILDEAFGTRAWELAVAAPGAELLTAVNAAAESGPMPVSADTGPPSDQAAGTPTARWASVLLTLVALASIFRRRHG